MGTASDFVIENGTLEEYRGPGGDVVIPDGVTSIGESAFRWCWGLTSVIIPEGVTSIGDNAFYGRERLKSVVIPDGVTSIGASAFSGCESLTSVIIPESVTSIGASAFEGCESLTSAVIPDGVTSIGASAFSGCESLTSVIIPESVTSIGASAFKWCGNLTCVTVPASVKKMGVDAFYGCKGMADANGFIILWRMLFGYVGNDTDIIIPEGIKYIGYGAFSGNKILTSVVIPEGVTYIGKKAFEDSSNLKHVVIPEGVTRIEKSTFSGCKNLTSVIIPKGVTRIGALAFRWCKNLMSVIIPESMTSIGEEAFYGCENLRSVAIPESVKGIGTKAFRGCKGIADAEGFVILNGILYDYIGKGVAIRIPEGVTRIDKDAFYGCSILTSVVFPEGITSIGDKAFYNCGNLASAVIPEGVTSIGNSAFYKCNSLRSVVIQEGVSNVGDWAFSYCVSLTNVVIPESLTSIGAGAFKGCESLTSVIIPESVTSIGEEAFLDSGLTSVVIPEGVKSIGYDAFKDCGKLQLISAWIIPSWETAAGCSFGLRLIQDKVRFLAFSSKSDRDNLTDYAAEGKWTKYDLELLNNGPEYRYRLPARLLGMIGRLMDPVELNDENKALMIEFLTKNAKKLLALAEEMEEPAVVSAMFENGIINSGNQKALLKLINASENPKIAALASTEVQTSFVKKSTPGKPTTEVNQWTKLFKDAGGEKEFRNMKLIGTALPAVKMKTGENAPEDLLKFILISYGRQLKTDIQIDPNADAAAGELSYESLCDAIDALSDHLDGPHYPSMLPVLCRYGNAAQIRELLKIQKQWSDWDQYGMRGRTAQEQLVRSLALSDTHEAVIWLNKNSTLSEYARLRGISEAEVYEKHLFDFGFDESGKKYYDLGTTTVEVSIGKELKLSLYDTAKRKVIRGLPQKGTDPDLRKKAADDLSDLRSNLKKAVSVKTDQLLSDWLQARTVQAEQWRNSYLKNPVLRAVGSLLVWTQGKTGFTLTETGTVTADGSPYPLGEAPVLLAHPMEMAPGETEQWQHYFAGNKLKQPFEQIWEPAYDAKEIREDRYSGAAVRFKYLKNRVKHGIDAGIYYTYEDVTDYINLKSCKIDYEIEEYATGAYFEDNRALLETKAILGKFSCKEFNRQVNHIVYLLDKLTVYERIAKDDASVRIFLPKYSLPQIMEFIQIANENQAINVQAMLMEYKDEHFSEFDPMDEFTLDLV